MSPHPLSLLTSITGKILAVVGVSAGLAALIGWWATAQGISPFYALPVAIGVSLVLALLVSSDISGPLRQATRAAKAMARGDYTIRVDATTSDEVGQLAEAFNSMAHDLAEVDQLHRDIVANVSHELRTPVAALRARLENMEDGVEDPTSENLGAAVRQAEHLTELLQYLLDLSRLDAGVAGLDIREVELAALVEEAVEVTRLATLQRGLDVNFSSRIEPLDLRINGDGARLMQVLVNVLDNAARHTPAGTTVHVDVGRAKNHVRIDVSDKGPGIAPEERERVFGRFQRATPPGAPATGGTGIGLAIARWAVSIHGGTIAILDTDVGATFRILLPLSGPGRARTRAGRAAPTHGPA